MHREIDLRNNYFIKYISLSHSNVQILFTVLYFHSQFVFTSYFPLKWTQVLHFHSITFGFGLLFHPLWPAYIFYAHSPVFCNCT